MTGLFNLYKIIVEYYYPTTGRILVGRFVLVVVSVAAFAATVLLSLAIEIERAEQRMEGYPFN